MSATEDSTLEQYLNRELRRLRTEWSDLTTAKPQLPSLTWEELMEIFLNKTQSRVEEVLVRGALTTLVSTHKLRPSEAVYEEIFHLTSGLNQIRAEYYQAQNLRLDLV